MRTTACSLIDLRRAAGAGRIIVPEPVFDEVTSGGHADAAPPISVDKM